MIGSSSERRRVAFALRDDSGVMRTWGSGGGCRCGVVFTITESWGDEDFGLLVESLVCASSAPSEAARVAALEVSVLVMVISEVRGPL